jgi:adenylosuccinate synthase
MPDHPALPRGDRQSPRGRQGRRQEDRYDRQGIGPTYEDKVSRRGLRVYDLFHPERFAEKLKEVLEYHNFVLTQYFKADAVDFQTGHDQAMADAELIKPMVVDVSAALYDANKAGHNMLFEGAQGTLLDIDHGTYPFVTSSNCVAGQAAAGAGIGPGMLHYVLGITKAYCTRVGGGPSRANWISIPKARRGTRCSRSARSSARLPVASVAAAGSMRPCCAARPASTV